MPPSRDNGFARQIARELYRSGCSSKTALVNTLRISLPTVLQNVRSLMERGVVVQDGLMASRGGRKAEALTLNADHAFAIGMDVTRGHVSLVGVDLRGQLRWHERLSIPFSADAQYAAALRAALDAFRASHGLTDDKVLGLGLSLPGILQNGKLAYSHALGVRDLPLEAPGARLPFLALNDANAAALVEKRLLAPYASLIYLSLSNSVGGAVFMNGRLYQGDHGRSGEFGHMSVVPDGRLCYCGKNGCYDGYGSALVLSAPYGGKLADFFDALSKGQTAAIDLWNTYRRYLALMCNHLRMAFDARVMLGGYVGAYLEPYLEQIRHEAATLNTFDGDGSYICCCRHKTEAAAFGAALMHIENYLDAL